MEGIGLLVYWTRSLQMYPRRGARKKVLSGPFSRTTENSIFSLFLLYFPDYICWKAELPSHDNN